MIWTPGPLKHWLALNDSGTWGDDPVGVGDAVVLRSTEIQLDGGWKIDDPAVRSVPEPERSKKRLRVGDLVVVKSSGSPEHLGKTAIVDAEVAALSPCFANFVQRLRPSRTADSRYIWYVLNSKLAADEMAMLGNTTTGLRNLNGTIIGSVSFPGPPLEQQRAIADFLDTVTARIDALITKKRRLIELLAERFESDVFHAVTRGVRGPTPLRRSGLDWVEQIPAGWGTPTVSANFELQLGKMLNSDAAAGPEMFPYVRNTNVQWDRLDLDDLAEMNFDSAERRRCGLRVGDLLVCEGGEVGRAAVWNGELTACFFQKAIHRVRPRGEANSRFLLYCLRAAAKRSVFAVEGNQSTIVHLTGEQLRSHRFPWPPPAEQKEIVAHLDRAAGCRASLTDSLARQIELLVEHRQALITAAVTGELEIPRVAA